MSSRTAPRLVVIDVDALYRRVEPHRPHCRREVELVRRRRAKPLAEVIGVRDRGGEADNADGVFGLQKRERAETDIKTPCIIYNTAHKHTRYGLSSHS